MEKGVLPIERWVGPGVTEEVKGAVGVRTSGQGVGRSLGTKGASACQALRVSKPHMWGSQVWIEELAE